VHHSHCICFFIATVLYTFPLYSLLYCSLHTFIYQQYKIQLLSASLASLSQNSNTTTHLTSKHCLYNPTIHTAFTPSTANIPLCHHSSTSSSTQTPSRLLNHTLKLATKHITISLFHYTAISHHTVQYTRTPSPSTTSSCTAILYITN